MKVSADIASELQQAIAFHRQGDLDAAAARYRGVLAKSPRQVEALHLLGIIAMQKGDLAEAESLFERTLKIDAMHHEALCNLGVVLRGQGKLDDALKRFGRSIALQPNAAETHYNRGLALLDLKREAEALVSFDRATALAPQHVEAHISRGATLERMGREAEAIPALDMALALSPGNARAQYNRGQARAGLGDVAGAESDFRQVLAATPEFAEAHAGLAAILLLTGRSGEGWREYAWRWQTADLAPRRRSFAAPQWQGEPVAGKTVLVHAEQGFGDTIQFSRFVREIAARGARVVVEVQPQLVGLLQDTEGAAQVLPRGEPLPLIDAHILMMDVPGVLGVDPVTLREQHPYISADPERVAAWDRKLGPRTNIRVGLAWSGNVYNRNNARRSATLATFVPLLQSPGVEFIALQPDAAVTPQERAQFPHLRVPGAEIMDFAETAALIANCDLVISVDTVFAHLSGALGIPTWVLLSSQADWRWLQARADSPWYPKTRLFRQPAAGAWAPMIAAAADALAQYRG